MREVNINIEGYNVNGICVGCLNYDRKMFYKEEIKQCFKILGNIDVPDGLSIQVCWECLAVIHTAMRFRQQIIKSFDILIEYSEKQLFLNSPNDFASHAVTRFSVTTFDIFADHLPKEEPLVDFDGIKDEIEASDCTQTGIQQSAALDAEVKQEDDLSYGYEQDSSEPILHDEIKEQSSEDDMLLSDLKTDGVEKRKKVKKGEYHRKDKRKEKKIKLKGRKLKNLPEKLVKLHTMDEEEMWSVRKDDASSDEFKKLKYKCENCLISFNNKKLMEIHISGKHSSKSENYYQCNICQAYFLTKENIKAHKKLHLTAYRCRECDLVTTMKRRMLAHDCAKNMASLGHYPCPDCPENSKNVFSTKAKLSYHRSVTHQERPQCDCCGKVFANKMTLKYHLKILPQNKEKSKEKLYLPCKGCDKVFYSKKSYRAHVVIHDGLTYPCPVCGKLFQWKRNLARHIRNHREREEGARHQCVECRKTFSSRDCYNNHMRLSKKHAHESSYIHACHFCGKKFATRWCMNDHIDWEHLKTIKYQCSICYKAFKTAKIMVAHVNNIHGGKSKNQPEGEHLCEICGKSYKTVKRLKGHVWAMHTNRSESKSYKCPLCPATFSWQTSIYKHIKMMHYTKRNKQPRIALKKSEPYPAIELANRMQYFQQNIANSLTQSIPPPNIVHN